MRSQSPSLYSSQNRVSTSILDDSYEPNQSSFSPGSAEVTSDIFVVNNEVGHLDGTDAESGTSTDLQITLRRLEQQLSLNDDKFEEISSFGNQHETADDSSPQHHQEKSANLSGPDGQGLFYNGYNGRQGNKNGTCFKLVKYLAPLCILCFHMFTDRHQSSTFLTDARGIFICTASFMQLLS